MEVAEEIQKEEKEKAEQITQEETVGLGDVVEKVTEATGIKKLVKWLAGEDCGCDERKEKLNKIPIFQRRRTINCLTEDEHDFLTGVFNVPKARFNREAVFTLVTIYNRVFTARENPRTTCSTCVAKVVRELKAVWSVYEG